MIRNPLHKVLRRFSTGFEGKKSLYVPEFEKDNCGVGLIANLDAIASRKTVSHATQMLARMSHRGGCGCDPNTGDGAGMLLALPHDFFKTTLEAENVILPDRKKYAVGQVFYSNEKENRDKQEIILNKIAQEEFGLEVLASRDVPTNSSPLGKDARLSEPFIKQVFFSISDLAGTPKDIDLELLKLRNRVSKVIEDESLGSFYVCSLSPEIITYKGQLTPEQLSIYFLDMQKENFQSHMALVHSRFSTNTFPSWARAQPNRMLCHNGEINTLRGNKNWMLSRQNGLFQGEAERKDLLPVCSDSKTDSGNFDSVLELLTHSSPRSISENMLLLIPEAYRSKSIENGELSPERKAFYDYNSCVMEPWDGPAMMAFTDGRQIGALLDRNGLRPSRYYVTQDRHVMLSSEIGLIDSLKPSDISFRGRLEPGKIFLVDFEKGAIVPDQVLKDELMMKHPYKEWVDENLKSLASLTSKTELSKNVAEELPKGKQLVEQKNRFGHTVESDDIILNAMGSTGKEPLGSMGVDIPLAVLSELPKQPSEYFKQLFAQVTNPPIDPIREEVVMDLACPVGKNPSLINLGPENCEKVVVEHPILNFKQFETLKTTAPTSTLSLAFNPNQTSLSEAIDRLCEKAKEEITINGAQNIVISQNIFKNDELIIPSLLAIGSLQHYLIDNDLRQNAVLIADANDSKEVHDYCTLVGFGADAIFPRLSFASIVDQTMNNRIKRVTPEEAMENYRKAIGKGIQKVMAKIGISSLQSYKGAQIFEAVGIQSSVIDKCFKGTTSRIQGVDFDALEQDLATYALYSKQEKLLRNPGEYHLRHNGEVHQNSPEAMTELQVAVRNFDPEAYKRYSEYSRAQNSKVSLRGVLEFSGSRRSIPVEEVEPTQHIIKRFVTGAMSLGSISSEAHEALAIAMNTLGGRSNTGEGGENPARFLDNRRSAIKQVASGRFGVTAEYLANSDQIQIKMAQGAKPGEGGELPGHKVSEEIASTRGTTPGVGLISPPPHHDIYSIEDLAQLIYDLKNVNPDSAGGVSVKLVSEVGVGIVAAGVAKAKADHIVISGGDGGTGAAAWTGVHRAGLPWELGLAEAQQTLVVNGLRSRVILQSDGQLKTGRDVVVAAILGAEEYGFSTAPLIALGCIMMRKCHLNTCPVGIATQDPELRKKFTGTPEHAVNFFMFLAEEIRTIMAELGIRRFRDLIGQTSLLKVDESKLHYKSRGLDLAPLLLNPKELNADSDLYNTTIQDHELEAVMDRTLITKSLPLLRGETDKIYISQKVHNLNRSLGAMLSGALARKKLLDLPDNSINVKLEGSAGQSLGFLLQKGVTFELQGDANDGVGKGLCGGKVIVYPKEKVGADGQVIVGNVVCYGATAGEVFLSGIAGERFCVRNSGASCVVEGVGDHACEYMTGGRVVVLGSTGRNFGAGMSGGIAYAYDEDGLFANKVNMEMVELGPVEEYDECGLEPEEELRNMIESHRRHTGSLKAKKILNHWDVEKNKFVKVMPLDYKNVLKQQYLQSQSESAAAAAH
eukprot:snap_masked-scaffold_38-processed-gene-1.30-mRNA-1 protein AED:0.00 eAED:0.00 QI:0/-1/0/1/-1/1/1/0/1523